MPNRSVVYRFSGDVSGLTASLKVAGRNVQEFGTKLTALDKRGAEMRRSLDDLGVTGGKMALTLGAALGGSAKVAVDWESAWAGVMKTTDGTTSQMARLEEQLRGLARTMPASHEEIAAVAEAAGQLGVAREDIADFTRTMLMLGETTNLTADEAATSIAQMANVMGTAPADIDNLGAALVALGNDGASTEAQIVQMAQRISGAGAQIGLTEANVLAIANAAASMGLEVEAGGTAVSRVFTSLARATAEGGPKLEAFAETAGLTVDEFSRLFAETPAEAFAAFTAGLDRINASGGNVFGTLKELGLSDVRVSDALLRMAASGDLLTDSLNLGNEAWEESSALVEEFAKRAGTTAAEMQTAWNNVKDATIDVGATMLPILSEGAELVSGLANAFQALPDPLQEVVVGATALTAVLGGGLWFGSKAISGIADTRLALQTLGIEGTRLRGSLSGASGGARQFAADLAIMATSARTAGAATERELARSAEAAQRLRGQLTTTGLRGGAALAGLTIAATGVADGMGLSDTASYALMGTLAGPWGAAIGGSIGLIQDFRATSRSAADSTKEWNELLDASAGSFSTFSTALNDARSKLDEMSGGVLAPIASGLYDINQALGAPDMGPGSGLAAQSALVAEMEDQVANLTIAAQTLGVAFGELGPGVVPSLSEMDAILGRAQPAMDALGISAEVLMDAVADGSIIGLVNNISAWISHADSAEGRTEALGNAFNGLDDEMTTTEQAAKSLNDALTALLSPQMDLSEATDEWILALRHLQDDLAKDADGVALHTQTLKGNSDAAITNRAAIRARVDALQDLIVAQSNADVPSEQIRRNLLRQRAALIAAGEAAGMSKRELRDYINELGLTPEAIRTKVELDGVSRAKNDIAAIFSGLEKLDGKTATTWIKTVQTGWSNKRDNMNAALGYAAGGHVPTYASCSPPAELIGA